MNVKDYVLQALEQARGALLSGEALAEQLGVSRAAVWKAIRALRDSGIQIDAAPGGGYRLLPSDDSLTEAGLRALLTTRQLGCEIKIVPSISSTNTVLKQSYMDQPHGFCLLAEAQTGGRGRLGRAFASPAGTGLYLSLLLRPTLALSKLHFLTIAAAVAVCRAIEQTAGFSPSIKWVNDVLQNGKKLCGILTEAVIEGESGTVGAVVVGIGINLRPNPAWPDEVRAVAGALSDFGTPPRRAVLAAALLGALEQALLLLENGNGHALLLDYRARLCCIGQRITVIGASERYEADCVALDDDGHLRIRGGDGQEHTLSTGEISIRLPNAQ